MWLDRYYDYRPNLHFNTPLNYIKYSFSIIGCVKKVCANILPYVNRTKKTTLILMCCTINYTTTIYKKPISLNNLFVCWSSYAIIQLTDK